MQIRSDKMHESNRLGATEKQQVKTTNFAEKLGSNPTSAIKSQKINDLRVELQGLALQCQSKEITQEEAVKRFVEIIAERRNDAALFGKKMEDAKIAVGQLLGGDPNFAIKLEEQLKKLAKIA